MLPGHLKVLVVWRWSLLLDRQHPCACATTPNIQHKKMPGRVKIFQVLSEGVFLPKTSLFIKYCRYVWLWPQWCNLRSVIHAWNCNTLCLFCLHCLRFVTCPSAWRRCWSDTSWLTTPTAPWQSASSATRSLQGMTTSKCTWRMSMEKRIAKSNLSDPKCIYRCRNSRLPTWPVSTVRRNDFTCFFAQLCWKYVIREKKTKPQRHSDVNQLENK